MCAMLWQYDACMYVCMYVCVSCSCHVCVIINHERVSNMMSISRVCMYCMYNIYFCRCMSVCIYVCPCMYAMYICMLSVCVYVTVYIYMYVCMYVHVHYSHKVTNHFFIYLKFWRCTHMRSIEQTFVRSLALITVPMVHICTMKT